MRPAGLESLPMGYTRLEFLQGDGNAYINSEYYPKSYTVVEMDGVFNSGGQSFPAIFSNEGRGMGNNRYSIIYYVGIRVDYGTTMKNLGKQYDPKHIIFGETVYFDDVLVHSFDPISFESLTPLLLFTRDASAGRYLGSISAFGISENKQKKHSFIPSLDTIGRPCMFDLVTRKSFYNQGTGQFIAGLTMGQARNLANLPVPTTINTLTISLPKEARLVLYNQEVNAAIAAAEAKGWSITVQYRDKFDDEAIRDKYAECVTLRDIININPEYYLDLTSAGEWIYPLPELTSPWQMWQSNPQLKAWLVDAPKLTNLGDFWAYSGGLEYIEFDFSNVESMGRNFTGCPLKTIPKGFNPKTRSFDYLFAGANLGYDGMVEFNEVVNEAVSGYKMLAIWGGEGQKFQLDPLYTLEHLVNGTTCFGANGGTVGGYYGEIRLNLLSLEIATDMFYADTDIYHFESPLPKLRTAKGMFGPDWRGRSFSLDKTSALSICNNIPNWEDGELHELTIGIYEGYNTDQEVLDALALAEEKGWTLTVQWGKVAPPEWTQAQSQATTYSMRRPETPPVYAKLGEPTEHPDGTIRPVLDWGHYITNWQENGYQEFASLEEAYEHFNLEMPAVEEPDAVAS